ncbi:MAG: GNAT family N-acetyltransferase [Clostridia bacterium]|nr:GNAT family N-acetyltransferase [Clostridia bacterium]
MKYNDTLTLKDGRKCLIRNGELKDGKAALDNFILTHKQTDYLLTYPDENTFGEADEAEYLQKKADSENEIELVAQIEGKIVGLAGIDAIGGVYKLKHRAQFGVSVDKDYWGQGIGRALTRACISCAREAGYTQIELDVVSDNKAAVSLYKSEGFKEYGRNKRGFRTRSGEYKELILMLIEL